MRWFGWLRREKKPDAAPSDGSPITFSGGRERIAGVPYALPRDAEETNRLDFQHYILRYAFKGLYAAPIATPASILDVGTGTGRWAIEMAQLYPQARVVGCDLAAPAVDERATSGAGADLRPGNYEFIAANVLEGLPFPDASFDFVHQRLLFLAIPAARWPFVTQELTRVTRPGGWVELLETTAPRFGGPNVDLLFKWGAELVARRGVDTTYGEQVGPMLRQASGMTNVSAQEITVPFGAHGGRVGTMLATDLLSAIKGIGGLFVAQGLATQEQFDQTLAAAFADAASPEFQCVSPFYLAYGQRSL